MGTSPLQVGCRSSENVFYTFSLSSKIQTLNKNLSVAQETLLLIIDYCCGCSSHLLIEHLLNHMVFNDMLECVTDKTQQNTTHSWNC